jgi:hypothetical protein
LKSSNNKSYSLLQKLHIHIYLKFWSKGRISFDQINSSLFKDFRINGKGHYLAWAWPILLFLGQPSGQRRCVPPLSPCPGLPISPSPSPVPRHTRAVKSHAARSNGLEPLPHAVGPPPPSPSTNVCCPPPYSTCLTRAPCVEPRAMPTPSRRRQHSPSSIVFHRAATSHHGQICLPPLVRVANPPTSTSLN